VTAIDIRLPHFIEDDAIADAESPFVRNFTLSLQSVICHRGTDLSSGHYVCFIRGTTQVADGDFRSTRRLSTSSQPPQYPVERWFKHDDLALSRVIQVPNIVEALNEEMPYLLFYQVQPTYKPQSSDIEPPAYSESGIDVTVSQSSPVTEQKIEQDYFDGAISPRLSADIERPRRSINLPDDRRDIATLLQEASDKIGPSANLDDRRGSVTFDESLTSERSSIRVPDITSTPATPTEETTGQRLSRAASKFRTGSKSRPTSSSGDSRISATISRLAQRSREQLQQPSAPNGTAMDSSIAMTDGSADPAERLPSGAVTPNKGASKGKRPNKGKESIESSENRNQEKHEKHKVKVSKDMKPNECSIM
jgi:hypothetical protein